MKVRLFIILMVIQAITCEKAVSKLRRKLIVPKMNEKCKKIKCAAVDEPVCVRMRRHDLSLTINIIAVNKCEMEYMQCHDDVEAKIVPMKYCSHNVDQIEGKKKSKPSKAHIRVKRRVRGDFKPIMRQDKTETKISTTEEPRTGFKDNNNRTKHPKLKKLRINTKNLSLKLKNEDSNVIPEGNRATMKGHGNKTKHPKLKKLGRINSKKLSLKLKNEASNVIPKGNQATLKGQGTGRQNQESLHLMFSSETDSDVEYNERKRIQKGIAGHLVDIEEDNSMQHLQLQPKAFMSPSMIGTKGNRPYSLFQTNEEESNSGSQELGPEFTMLSHEAVNISKESLTDLDKEEYDELCPRFCPSRDVMVCGRCHHGVYKTFISVCHMRMFVCNHQDETLKLMARYPCVLSAPYMADSSVKPKASISELGDDDRILRFIKCRKQGQLGTEEKPPADPRCDFKEKPVRRGIGIELSSSSSEKDSSSDSLQSTRSSEWSKTSDNSSSDQSSSYSESDFSSYSDSSSC